MSARVLTAVTTAAVAALFAAPSALGQLSLSSNFDESNEGWQQVFGFSSPTPATGGAPRSPSGGNPGGYILSTEANSGDPENPLESVLVSPASWSGDALANYGGAVAFDARSLLNTPDPNATPDFPFQVVLFRGTLPLTEPGEAAVSAVVDTDNGFAPGTWTRYSIALIPERWTTGGGDIPASEYSFRYVLKNLGGIAFSVDAYDGPSTGNLDNPSFGGGSAPPPAVYARTLTISHSARAFRGVLSSEGTLGNCLRDVVKVYRKKRGADPKVGEDETSDVGAYEVAARRKPGRYYARVRKQSVSAELGVSCGAARSPVLTID